MIFKNNIFIIVNRINSYILLTTIFLIIPYKEVFAGPPFLTDDPETVEYKHTEINIYSQGIYTKNEGETVLPGVDANFGILPDVQMHLLAQMPYNATNGQSTYYGNGDTELGIKYRFLNESEGAWWPQIAIYPAIDFPTGNASKNLGTGYTHEFFPVWIQKDFNNWQTFGGGGYWNNPGIENKNYWFFGWALQNKITDKLTLGVELFHQTASAINIPDSSGFNLGGTYDLNKNYHILFSTGHGIENSSDTNQFSYYLALQLTY